MNGADTQRMAMGWLLLSIEGDRQYGGNLGYADEPGCLYRYDSFVPNHRRVSVGDPVIIRAGRQTIGVATITEIESRPSQKQRRRCPTCGTNKIKRRTASQPPWRYDDGHEFAEPLQQTVPCTQFIAKYGDTFVPFVAHLSPEAIRLACERYNAQHAIQRIDLRSLAASLG